MNASYKTNIIFSNMNIPVKMVKTNRDDSLSFNQLCKDSKERVRYKKFCPSCDKEITNSDIIKGYQYTNNPDKYVIISNDEIDSITSDLDKALNIQYFCKPKEINGMLMDKSYYLVPEIVGEKDYILLRKSMTLSKVVAISEIVLGTKQELVAIIPHKDCLIATLLFYENELNPVPNISAYSTSKTDIDNLRELINKNTKNFDLSSHYDEYQSKLMELIKDKIQKIGE